jgi:hypothetical protein
MSQPRSKRLAFLSALASVLACTGLAAAQSGTVTQTNGPDIIVGDLPDVTSNPPITINNISYAAFAVGTTSCNRGNQLVNWFTGGTDNRHPAISQNLFRYTPSTGRFEQIGQGSLKHGFTALQGSTCNSYFAFGCTPNPAGGTGLGVGCSDPYGSGLNDSPGSMGPRWSVNASTGLFPYPYTADPNSGPSRVRISELNNSAANARYFIEGQYICGDDAAFGNQNNNASWREVSITASAGTPPTATAFGIAISAGSGGVVHREQPGIYAWQMIDPAVVIRTFDVPNDGRFVLACKVTGTGPYTYEYALQNLNSHRCAGSLVVPLPGTQAALSGIGFHDVEVVGEPNALASPSNPASDDWTLSGGGASATSVSWSGPSYAGTMAVYGQGAQQYQVGTFTAGTGNDHSANVIRWGTLFNFRFTSEVAPGGSGSLAVGLWRPGSGTAFVMNNVPTPGGATVGTLTATCCTGTACSVATQSACGAGIWGLPGSTCSPNPCVNGACCLTTLTCTQYNATNCSAQGGTYSGDGTTCATASCPTPGACCLPAGTCAQTTPASCTGSNGNYHGNSTSCGAVVCPTGACCASAGTCTITASNGCTTSGSVYQGDGSTCATTCPVGACCIATSQTCSSVNSAGCSTQGGSYQGDGTTCGAGACPFGACCQGSCAGCIVATSAGCSGGTYLGDGSTCGSAGCSFTNGGFETGDFTGWTTGGNFSITAVYTGSFAGFTPHGGAHASYWGSITTDASIQQTIGANAGDTVTIGFWYGIAGGGSNDHFLATFDGQTLFEVNNDTGHTTWTQFTFGPIIVSANNPVLSFASHNNPSYDVLDDITVCITPAPMNGACCHASNGRCSLVTAAQCPAGDSFMGVSSSCTPSPCAAAQPGLCCRGAGCTTSFTSAGDCTGSVGGALAGAVFTATGSCNASGNTAHPCCYADYNKVNGVGVPDIFDFLNDWFGGRKFAIPGGDGNTGTLTVQNIFDFLNAWFAGCA